MATLNNWEAYLNDIIDLLHVLGFKVQATAVRDVLIDARTNGTIVTDPLFPYLLE
jgi:hypothetical protein